MINYCVFVFDFHRLRHFPTYKYYKSLVYMFVLDFHFSPGISEVVDDVSEGCRLAQLDNGASSEEEKGEHEVVVEWLDDHRRDRSFKQDR